MSQYTLDHPAVTAAILEKYHFTSRKKYGQNFLVDGHVLDEIMEGAQITPDDVILEIGPGIGTMTQRMARMAKKVIGVEIDKELMPILAETLDGYSNVRIINADVMKLDLKALAEEENQGNPFKIVANLPYYITTPIIMNLFEEQVPLTDITIMVQKEVAERMMVGPGTKSYGALSLAVQYYARPALVADVPSSSFLPQPQVDSTVIHLTKYKDPPVKVKDERQMFRIIRASFNQRRKTLVNGLKNAPDLGFTREEIETALAQLGKDKNIRGEVLTLEEFARLSDLLPAREVRRGNGCSS